MYSLILKIEQNELYFNHNKMNGRQVKNS